MILKNIELLVILGVITISSLYEVIIYNAPNWPDDYAPRLKDGDYFDYIVVGAGTAGCAAGARLSLGGARVLVVEAGHDPNMFTRIPGMGPLLLGSEMDWQYETESNGKSCLSSKDKACRFSGGKCLGGSSTMNFMIYTRGSPSDYDDWNVDNWSWDDIEPYFLRYEAFHDLNKLPLDSWRFHNKTGIMDIEFFKGTNDVWHHKLREGFKDLNFTFNSDVNAGFATGFTKAPGYVYKGERMSSARAYLTNEAVRRRILVAKHTTATKVIIDDNGIARGVSVVCGHLKRKLNLYVRKEVILSAGTVGSAHILLSSGVGPAEQLESYNVTVHSDLPVGVGMTDHVQPFMMIRVNDNSWSKKLPHILKLAPKGMELMQWLFTRKGPLASTGLTDTMTFCNTDCYDFENHTLNNRYPDCDSPNLQMIFSYMEQGILSGQEETAGSSLNFDRATVKELCDANEKHALIIVNPIVLKPKSMGSISLNSANPEDRPKIDPNYLSDERDVDQMVASIRILEDLVSTSTLKDSGASIVKPTWDDCPDESQDWSGYWRCYARHMTMPVFHAVGTAAMGRVVDWRLRVQGVSGLRVADLSVAPMVPSGNTAALALAIGERVADFTLEDNS